MTYEEIVDKARAGYENADARTIFEHIAIQVNIDGEGKGAFYIEVAERSVCVEPYDYHDRDILITTTGPVFCDIAAGKLTLHDAIEKGLLRAEGNQEKLRLVEEQIILPTKKKTKKTLGERK